MRFSLQKKLHASDGPFDLDVNCEIEEGSFISLYGPSGAGKTSLLRMLAGFLKPDVGRIEMNGEVWFDRKNKINTAPQKRAAGFVFQDYALFPNMNVEENIRFAMVKNTSKKLIDELLELTALTGLRHKKIQMLSGGQQQRVALARALARKPKLLLLDEPLSAIDNEMRTNLQQTLLSIHSHYKITAIIVSHDLTEISRLTSKTLFLKNGKVEKFTDPSELFFNGYENKLRAVFLSVEKTGSVFSAMVLTRSEERRVGKECRSRWSPYH